MKSLAFLLLGLEDWLYRILGTQWCGNTCVPLENVTLHWKEKYGPEYVASFLNDSFEVGIGFPSQWLAIMRRESFHKVIRWYLWNYLWKEWFGLRRWAWYKLLHRRCTKHESRKSSGYPDGEGRPEYDPKRSQAGCGLAPKTSNVY